MKLKVGHYYKSCKEWETMMESHVGCQRKILTVSVYYQAGVKETVVIITKIIRNKTVVCADVQTKEKRKVPIRLFLECFKEIPKVKAVLLYKEVS